jgi:guanylate kinase
VSRVPFQSQEVNVTMSDGLELQTRDEGLPPLVNNVAWETVRHATSFVFLDGASASGKSTIKNALLRDPAFSFSFARRYTTRAIRPDDAQSNDYIFVTTDKFLSLDSVGDLIECRHFLFGMSYGIGKSALVEAAKSSRNVLSLMNLGNVKDLKAVLPNAICILIDAPLEVIERRVRQRGFNSNEQIAERLQNARSVKAIRGEYDFVVENDDGCFDSTYYQLSAFLRQVGLGI